MPNNLAISNQCCNAMSEVHYGIIYISCDHAKIKAYTSRSLQAAFTKKILKDKIMHTSKQISQLEAIIQGLQTPTFSQAAA